jgi:hypothetical protein
VSVISLLVWARRGCRKRRPVKRSGFAIDELGVDVLWEARAYRVISFWEITAVEV